MKYVEYADHFRQVANPVGAAHGDVILRRIEKLPEGVVLKEKQDRCVAYGEVTGHHHKIFGDGVQVLEVDQKPELCFVVAPAGCEIKHQEHGTIEFQPGTYEVVRQYEFTERDMRRVMD